MYKPFLSGIAALVATTASTFAAAFLPGDLVVEQVGDGTTTLSAAAFNVSLLEFAPAGGVPVQTIPLQAAGTLPTSSPFNVTDSKQTSHGLFNRSADGKVLTVPGYNAVVGTLNVSSTAFVNNSRTIAVASINGTVDTSTSVSMFGGTDYRSVVSNTGSQFWAAGASASAANVGGIVYVGALGSIGSSNVVGLFGFAIGVGLPTTAVSSANVTQLISTGGSPYGFVLSPDGLTAYVADDRAFTNVTDTASGGIQKWTRATIGSAFTYAYTLGTGTGSLVGARGLTVDFAATNSIYAITSEASANRLILITDLGSASPAATLATATTNLIFRGVDFAPVLVPEPSAALSLLGGAGLLLVLRRRRNGR